MKLVHGISYWLVIIGGLNWGLVALGTYMGGNWNLVNLIFGSMPAVETLVYLVVGIAALVVVFSGKCGGHNCGQAMS